MWGEFKNQSEGEYEQTSEEGEREDRKLGDAWATGYGL